MLQHVDRDLCRSRYVWVHRLHMNKARKKTSESKDKKDEIYEIIKDSFPDVLPSSALSLSFNPTEENFLTFSSCVNVLKNVTACESQTQRTQIRLTIHRGRSIERIRRLKKIKMVKMRDFLKNEVQIDLSRSTIFFAVKLYKLSTRFPVLTSCILPLHFVQKHFTYLEDYLEEKQREMRRQTFDDLMTSPMQHETSGLTQELSEVTVNLQ